MTPEEHDHVQQLEALVKRYRRRIVELKAMLAQRATDVRARDVSEHVARDGNDSEEETFRS